MLKYFELCQSKNIFVGNKYFPVEIWHLASRQLVGLHRRVLLLVRCQSTSHLKKKNKLLLTFKILTAPNISFSFYDHLNDLLIVIKCFKLIFVTYSRLSVYYHFISILLARKYQSNNYYRYNITPLHPNSECNNSLFTRYSLSESSKPGT